MEEFSNLPVNRSFVNAHGKDTWNLAKKLEGIHTMEEGTVRQEERDQFEEALHTAQVLSMNKDSGISLSTSWHASVIC